MGGLYAGKVIFVGLILGVNFELLSAYQDFNIYHYINKM